MAEGKKSFLMYAEWRDVVVGLTDAEAGRLFKHIMRYVNDENPELKNRIVALAFEPMKKQFKRDLKSWKEKGEANSKAGQLGNLKRWHKDLYELVESKNMDLETAWNIAKHRETSRPDRTRSHPIAKIAVEVDDDVDVEVKVDVEQNNLNNGEVEKNADQTRRQHPQQGKADTPEKNPAEEKPNQKAVPTPPSQPVHSPTLFLKYSDYDRMGSVLKDQRSWVDNCLKRFKIEHASFLAWIDKWIEYIKTQAEETRYLKPSQNHCANWINKELEKPNNKKAATSNAGAYAQYKHHD